MTSILKDSDITEVEDLIVDGNLDITGDISNSSTLEFKAPTVVINGGTGDTKLQIKADTDNSGETDNPSIEFFQDGEDAINSTIGIGLLSGQTNANALILSNSVASTSGQDLTGGIMFKTGETADPATSTERLLIHPDGTTKVLFNLDVAGNILMGDDDFIQFGASNDMSIGHNPDTNFVNHSKQIQFKSTMSSGDSYKFLETGQRKSVFLFTSNNSTGSEKSNYYFTFGNDDTDATDRSYMLERIRRQDGTGLHTIIEKSQVGNTVDTAVVDTLCIAKFSNDVHIADDKSIYLGDSNDLRITHNGTDSFIQDANQGNLHIRTNGTFIGISDTTSSTNFMAKFIKDGATELYHNKIKKFETTATGILVSGDIENNYKTAIVAGSGFDAALISSNIRMVDNEIISTFLIDLQQGPITSSGSHTIIGESGSSAAHFTQIQSVLNGYVYKVELCCIETPAGGNDDIDLVFNATSQSTGGSSFTVVVNAGAQVRGKCTQALLDGSFDLDFKLLHLATGAGSGTGNYTAGKFIVKLYAANF